MLTNDDGIDAPGFEALEQACENYDRIVVAPDQCHSSMSHHVTTDRAIQVNRVRERRFRVSAGPADCARLANTELAPGADWLIAGINRGGNLGMDICYSGTVAAAREAALLGWRAIAISHLIVRGRELRWDLAALRARRIIERLVEASLEAREFWNVNLPHPEPNSPEPELVFCDLDTNPLPVNYRIKNEAYCYVGHYPDRKRLSGSDVDLCFSGSITATRMRAGF